MTRMHKSVLAISLAALLHSPALAEGGDSGGFAITATVPEVCQLDAPGVLIGEGDGTATTSVFEMCNSGRTFRIVASHRTLEAGEHVQISYAGQVAQLSASGVSHVGVRNGPILGDVPVMIQSEGLATGIAISIGMMAV